MDWATVLGAVRKLLHEGEMRATCIEPSLKAPNILVDAKCRPSSGPLLQLTCPAPFWTVIERQDAVQCRTRISEIGFDAGVIGTNLFKKNDKLT